MLRRAIQHVARRLKGGDFSIAESVSDRELLALLTSSAVALQRGLWLTLCGQRPSLLFAGRGVRISGSHHVELGRGVRLGDYVQLSALGSGTLSLGDNVTIGAFSRLIVSTSFRDPQGHIRIGPNVGLGEFAYLGGAGGLEIGADTIVGQYLSVHPENHVFTDVDTPIRLQGVSRQGIRIGANCWLGAKVTILDGVTLGEGCVVAAGAVVTRSFPAGSVIGGVPAKLLKRRA